MDLNTDMNLSQAVKEILEAVLKKPPACKDNLLHVHIKSSAKNIASSSKSWFYVKVLTSLSVKKETLSDLPGTSALYEILRCMHELEDESHLCLQCPSSRVDPGPNSGPGADTSVQYNLVLSESSGLQVQQEVAKQKPAQYTTLYLRMHENLLHVMRQSGEIHNYLRRLKVFRPQWDIAFNMKLGDIQSKNDFWVEDWKSMSEKLPCIVTQTDFYLRLTQRSMTEICSSALFSLPSHLDVVTLFPEKTQQDQDIAMQLSASCLIIPAPKSVEYTRVLAFMTLYGPGFIPLEVKESCLSLILEAVCWSELGFKMKPTEESMKKDVVFPCHVMVAMETYKHENMENTVVLVFLVLDHVTNSHQDTFLCRYDIESTLKQNQLKFVQCIERVLEKAFTPLQEKLKSRKLAMRSITSVCKAITDIVTMSDNEAFRKAVLNNMQASDTVDLGSRLEERLTNISKQKHHAVWMGAGSDASRMQQNTQEKRDSVVDEIMESGKRRRLSLPIKTMPDTVTSPESPAVVKTTTALSDVSPFHEFADSDADSATEVDWEASDDPGPTGEYGDRTPDIAQITASLQQASPFQELGQAELGEHHACTEASRTSIALYGSSVSVAQATLTEDPYKLVNSNLQDKEADSLGFQQTLYTSEKSYKIHTLTEHPYKLVHSSLQDKVEDSLDSQQTLSAFENTFKLFHCNLFDHTDEMAIRSSSQPVQTVANYNAKGNDFDTNLLGSRQNLCNKQLTSIADNQTSTSTIQKEVNRSDLCSNVNEKLDNEDRLDVEDWSATFNVVSDFIDNTAADITRVNPTDIGSKHTDLITGSSHDMGSKHVDIINGILNEKGDNQANVPRGITNKTETNQAYNDTSDPKETGDSEAITAPRFSVVCKDSTDSCHNLPDSDDWFDNVLDEVEDWLS